MNYLIKSAARKSITLLSAAILLPATYSCRKTSTNPAADVHQLGLFYPSTIWINQAQQIYDSTALKDSADFLHPPTKRIYEWLITPDNQAAVFGGSFKNGFADISFTRSGTYQVTANIYDSSNHKLVGHTNRVTITVTTDTLRPTEPVNPTDQLTITANVIGKEHIDSLGDVYIMSLGFYTADRYTDRGTYDVLDYHITGGNNTLSIVFTDSIRLTTYPFEYGSSIRKQIGNQAFIALNLGETSVFTVTWLNKVYTGSVTLLNPLQLSFKWDNSGPVKINY